VTVLAERRVIVLIPEEVDIALMGLPVIRDLSQHDLPSLSVQHAERIVASQLLGIL
jgi:hypothetical protein